MEKKNKILLVEQNPSISIEIARSLKNSGFEVTNIVPFIDNAIESIKNQKPDVIMIDAMITEQVADFISTYIKLPLIIISDQFEKEIYNFSGKITILSVIPKPYNINNIQFPVKIAFNKLN
jgi:DNA-binding response OmpR family regulator